MSNNRYEQARGYFPSCLPSFYPSGGEMIRIPGLIDPHVHVREPGATHKEDWDSCTSAALAGGFTAILAMPNTQPPITTAETLDQALNAAKGKARCDFSQFLGAGEENIETAVALASRSAGLKLYLDVTYGPLRLDSMALWLEHLRRWPAHRPVVAHAEGRTTAALILTAALAGRAVHICHVATREEILIIRAAKEKGYAVTCEVAPHHLFLSTDDLPRLPGGRGEVRPRLAQPSDRNALLDNLDVIDCFATDHAPHTLAEKDSPNPPPGFPGLETALPLFYGLVRAGRLTVDGLVERMHAAPMRIFGLPLQTDTWVDFDPNESRIFSASEMFTRCAWTPFEGMQSWGRVHRVTLRGQVVYEDGRILAQPGSGRDLRE
jgi:carbamoyl-phosphate synthase / aspartate carbamoyltransferase / dihydroorotase